MPGTPSARRHAGAAARVRGDKDHGDVVAVQLAYSITYRGDR